MKPYLKLCLIGLAAALGACSMPDSADEAKLEVAREMVQAWNERQWDQVYELFAENGALHSMMLEPIVGRENIRARLSGLTAGIEQIELQIRNIGVVGDVVMIERVDDFVYRGKHGSVPVVGVMEIAGGKVTEWREYYDHATLAAALMPDSQTEAEGLAEAESELLALTEKFRTDWNDGDMDAYLDAYWRDERTSVLWGDVAVRGWQALADLFTSTWPTEAEMGDFITRDVMVRFPGPGVAIVSGRYEHQFPDKDLIIGMFSHTWHRFDDGWKIVNEHTSRKVE